MCAHSEYDTGDFVFFGPFFVFSTSKLSVITENLADYRITRHFIPVLVRISTSAFAKRTFDADMFVHSDVIQQPDVIADGKLSIVFLLNHNSFLRNLSV